MTAVEGKAYFTQEVSPQMRIAARCPSTVDDVGPVGQNSCSSHVNVADQKPTVGGVINV